MRVQKALASAVVTGCLATQIFVTLWPAGEQLWPFLRFAMYSGSHGEGETVRVHELRAVPCGVARTEVVDPLDLGLRDFRYWSALRQISVDGAAAPALRAQLARIAGASVVPEPCALQVWEKAVRVTRAGATPAAPRWVPVRQWSVADPDAVWALTAAPSTPEGP